MINHKMWLIIVAIQQLFTDSIEDVLGALLIYLVLPLAKIVFMIKYV